MKLLDYQGLQRFLSKIKTLLDGKSNTGHTHVTSEVTDLLNSQHTWSAQQSYSADLNLNYASTDVDDILDTVAGSYTAEDFLAQNNVWTGINQFTDTIRRRSTSYEIGNTPASNVSLPIRFTDKNNDSIGWVRSYVGTSGATETEIVASNKFKNNALDPTGTQTYQSLKVGIDNTGSVYHQFSGKLKQSELPFTTDTYDLGSSSYQWNNVYAKNYYYNGAAFGDIVTHNASEFLTSHQSLSNYVTLNSAQIISGIKTITGGNQGKMVFKNPNYTKGDANESSVTVSRIYFGNNASYDTSNAVLSTDINTSGNSIVELCAIDNTASSSTRTSLILTYDKSATRKRLLKSWGDFIPYGDSTYDLGSSSYQWNSIYAQSYYYNGTQWGLDQTNEWSALNTYSSGQIRIKSQSQEIGVTPSNNVIQYLEFTDKNDAQRGIVGLWDYDNGASEIQMYVVDKFKNGQKDPTGTAESTFLSFGFKTNGSKFLTFSGQVDNSVIPKANNSYDLGSSSYQWNNIYAKGYYYNGTAWGLDKTNEWTSYQQMSCNPTVWNMKNTSITLGTTPSSNRYLGFIWLDSADTDIGRLCVQYSKNGSNYYIMSLKNSDGTTTYDGALRYSVSKNNARAFYPEVSACDLGLSTNKWSNCHATTFYENGTALSSKYVPIEKLSNVNVSLKAGVGTIIYGAGYSTSITVQQTYIVQAVNLFYVRYTNLRSSSFGYEPYIRLSDTPMSYGVWEYMGSKDGAQISDTYLLGFWKRIS